MTLPTSTRSRIPSWGRMELTIAVTFMAFVSVLPLEWVSLSGAAGGVVKPFHVLGLLFIGMCLARWPASRFISPVLRRYPGVYLAYFCFLVWVMAAGLSHSDPYMNGKDLVRAVLYVTTSLFVASFFLHVVGRRTQHLLVWIGVSTTVVLVAGLGLALAAQDVNPISLFAEAIAQANPDLIAHRLFRAAFSGATESADASANLRHKVFSADLLALFLSLALMPVVRARRRLLVAVAAVGGFGIVMLSLSRSLALCLVAVLGLAAVRAFVTKRARPRQANVMAAAAMLTVLVALSPVGALVAARFSETQSIQTRSTAATTGFVSEFQAAAIFGTQRASVAVSPHNVFLLSWLSGGAVGAVFVLAFLVSYIHVWCREARRYFTAAAGWVIPVSQQWVLGIGLLPLVRAVSAGDGLHMVEWTAVGAFLGLTYANRRAVLEGRSPEPVMSPAEKSLGSAVSG
ncbi:MAG: hypothetical protein M3256_13590 [Actinomycetota bacterium]|nr:hypothetical protein [Actinomycetota bacterium]